MFNAGKNSVLQDVVTGSESQNFYGWVVVPERHLDTDFNTMLPLNANYFEWESVDILANEMFPTGLVQQNGSTKKAELKIVSPSPTDGYIQCTS